MAYQPASLSQRVRAAPAGSNSAASPSYALPSPHAGYGGGPSSLVGGSSGSAGAALGTAAMPTRASSLARPAVKMPGAAHIARQEAPILAVLTLTALIVRCWALSRPSSVVFDEVHFGGFASKYVNQRFFMDVHPPLAKLLLAFVAWAAGFNGAFDFKEIGREYLVGDNTPVPYVAMRMLSALLGVLTVPLAYLTLRALSLRVTTALVGGVLLTFENALVTQSRLILLDSPLLFFTSLTTFAWTAFCIEEKRRAFGKSWWIWLLTTGVSLGCVASVKWVGLFTITTIGLCTIVQLWAHLGDVRQPMSQVLRHFLARAACLIVVPFFVYLTTFAIHLAVLNRSGEGDAFMSSAFQHTLRGHGMPDTYADVALGSTVTIRHLNTQGGYLHSHSHNYPAGSGQQQITLYPHRDENNEFYVIAAPKPDDPPPPVDKDGVPLSTDGPHEIEKYSTGGILHLTHGMEVRLIHRKTDKRLHSHDSHRPPITEADYQNEVTAYGFPGFLGDANDNWHVEIERGDPSDSASSSRVRSLRSIVRFRHTLTGCYLFSHKIPLPDWGFGQQEVTCNKNPTKPNSLWFVETSTHPLLENNGMSPGLPAERKRNHIHLINYLRPSFWARFKELQAVMWETNAGLTERHPYDSRPIAWPLLRRGINFWTKDHRQIYLIGNPFVWLASTTSVFVYIAARALLMLRAKRGKRDWNDSTVVFYDATAGFLFTGWALHYVPFWLMHRQLFIHHYLPALYFSILLLAVVFDVLTSFLKPRFRLQAAAAIICVSIFVFSIYAPLTYAGTWTRGRCERARLAKTWDFNCVEFPETLAEYSGFGPAVHTVAPPSANTTSVSGTSAAGQPLEAQAGNHAFEEVPKLAQSSGVVAAADLSAEAQAAAQAGASPLLKIEEVHDDGPLPQGHVVEEVAIEGLDHEGVEAVVLQGTAAVAATVASEAPKASITQAAPADPNAPGERPDDDVRIGREDAPAV